MAEEISEYVEWLKLPHDLQSKFFQKAEEESARVVENLGTMLQDLENIKPLIEPRLKKITTHDRQYIVGAVDGSRSPNLSERIGARYGVFTAGAVTIRGNTRLDERYEAGIFKRRQVYSKDKSRHFFSLLTMYAERKLALELLDEVDLLLLDGSFYGFVYTALPMLREGKVGDEEKRIIADIKQMTDKLLESRKAIAVIKRSHASIIGGWIALEENKPDNPYVRMLDKLLLTYLMPGGAVFYYDDLIGEKHPAMFYIRLAALARMGWPEERDPVKRAYEVTYDPFTKFQLDYSLFNTLTRMQVKAYDTTPVCEIEYSRLTPRDRIGEWLGQRNFFSDGTGLPTAIDLVDQLVGIPAKFTDEFVAEIEARALEKLRGKDPNITRIFFTYLNPQKPF